MVVIHDGQVIFGKNENEKMPMASTTKIMTAILAIENCSLDDEVEADIESCSVEGSSMYLQAGENYTVKELLEGLLLASGNDAAEVLAKHVSGTTEKFVELMNEKALELGLENTHFANPSGLPAEEHYSTALNMAQLLEYCMHNERFSDISSLKSTEIKNQYFTNHNKLLTIYNGCKGGKTGYTIAAGRCLVSCCEKNGLQFVCASLNAPDDWNDHSALYDWAYRNYTVTDAAEAAAAIVPVAGGVCCNVLVRPREKLPVFRRIDEEIEYVYNLPPFVFAPVKALDRAGNVIIKKNGAVIAESELCFCSDIYAAINERSKSND